MTSNGCNLSCFTPGKCALPAYHCIDLIQSLRSFYRLRKCASVIRVLVKSNKRFTIDHTCAQTKDLTYLQSVCFKRCSQISYSHCSQTKTELITQLLLEISQGFNESRVNQNPLASENVFLVQSGLKYSSAKY